LPYSPESGRRADCSGHSSRVSGGTVGDALRLDCWIGNDQPQIISCKVAGKNQAGVDAIVIEIDRDARLRQVSIRHSPAGRLPSIAATKYSPSISNGQPISARNALPMLLMRNSFKCNYLPWLIYSMSMTRRRSAQMPDWTIPQNWEAFRADEHAMWDRLFARQSEMLPGRAATHSCAGSMF
jgi:hypothetical protein